ncbi:hypothetical protein [Caballeronia sp. Lep1P3]|uniref:hypothetical protein n=1 Tax=Caballeronia sp. Lep1P3 TaxID=2878150 RepID=UPI001FD0CCB5|nr:hypothetical protein [Caballeronia sp. Lep1P3]
MLTHITRSPPYSEGRRSWIAYLHRIILRDRPNNLTTPWTVLTNELTRYSASRYPDQLCMEVLLYIGEVERLLIPDPFEQDLLITARNLAEQGELKIAMFKTQEVLSGRQI